MARYFQVTTPQGLSAIRLDSQGRAAVQYTVKNVTGAAIDGRAVLVSVPGTNAADSVVQKGWVKIDGVAERHFNRDQEDVFLVKIAVPPNAPAGKYTFRLDVVTVARPDEGDGGPVQEFSVSKTPPQGGGNPKWLLLIIVIVLVLLVGGVTVWLLTRKSGGTATSAPPQDKDACKSGFVWRQAVPADHVCVTQAVQSQTASDNRQAARRSPTGGPYGPDTCLQGYVWRDAVANDHVCVSLETRSQAAADNAQAANRKAQP
jgi:hypothetical protein